MSVLLQSVPHDGVAKNRLSYWQQSTTQHDAARHRHGMAEAGRMHPLSALPILCKAPAASGSEASAMRILQICSCHGAGQRKVTQLWSYGLFVHPRIEHSPSTFSCLCSETA
ncbi:hypothetical protein V2G26_009756 [Clonostachys chloroleuca]